MSLSLSPSLSSTYALQAVPNAPPTIFNISIGINLRRSSPPFSVEFIRRRCLCRGLSPGRPPPPPNGKDSGPTSTIARLQETTKIFLAVLFWMALFFWYSAWDGRNNDGGTSSRPKKGSWFQK